MKRNLLFAALALLSIIFQSCERSEHFDEDVFRVTYLQASNGCPGGPLVRFAKQDIDRLAQFVHTKFSAGFMEYRVISAVHLEESYQEGQSIVLKIRKFTEDEMHPCTANVVWYTGVYVLEVSAD